MALHNKHFYHQTIRKFVVSFGNIFNNLYVIRYLPNGEEKEREKVPMAYGPKEKYLYRNEQNKDLSEKFAIKLPRISYELTKITYASSRKTPSTNRIQNQRVGDKKTWSYNPVPFDFTFKVYVMGKTSDEALQIVEQIVPFFTPDHTLTVDIHPSIDMELDVPVKMDSVSINDNWDGTFQERRNIIWEMQFTLSGFLFPPARTSEIILQSEWTIAGYDDNGNPDKTNVYDSGIETQP